MAITLQGIVLFLRHFEEPKRSLKIVQRPLKICFYNSAESCVLRVNSIGGSSSLLNGSSSQTLKKPAPVYATFFAATQTEILPSVTQSTCPIHVGFKPTLMRTCCCGLAASQFNF